jgi:hypothetical protein
MIGGTNIEFNPNEIPPMPAVAMSGDYFIAAHYPSPNDSLLLNSRIITEEDKRKIKNLKEDDNQILVFFKLNNF